MIDEGEALERVLAAVRRGAGGVRQVDLAEAPGHYLGRDIVATVALPGFDNSAMDGYAVRSCDATTGSVLRVVGAQPAGRDHGLTLEPGEAVRIFTGAPMPAGADAVVMQEDTRPAGEGGVEIADWVEAGECVRRRGADVCEGQILVKGGERLGAGHIGLLAAQGMATLPCYRRPRVTVVATGDELAPLGSRLQPGQIYNSNAPMLAALAASTGCSGTRQIHLPDDRPALAAGLAGAAEQSDIVLISGGVSVGDYDFVKEALGDIGVPMDFWKVRIKPGKPFAFGRRARDGVLFFGLPGNPVSSYVTFAAFVLPAVQKWSGASGPLGLRSVRAVAAKAMRNDGDRPHYLRGILDGHDGTFRAEGVQQSFALGGLGRANALARLDEGADVPAGGTVVVGLL